MQQIKKFKSESNVSLNKFKKNKLAVLGCFIIIILVLLCTIAPILTKYEYSTVDLYNISSAPSKEHILGTDDLGRDMFTRLLYGGRVSLQIGIWTAFIQIVLGVTLGAIAGYFGGIIDSIIMRMADIIMCFPFFIIATTMAVVVGPSKRNLIIILGVLSWTGISRIVRSEVLSLKNLDYIQAAKTMGLNNFEIITRHILPNIMSSILVVTTLSVANAILMEAALSFLGMGVTPPEPSWGNILSAAQNMNSLKYEWWLWMPPGIMILITVLSINFIGEGIRKAIDPKEE